MEKFSWIDPADVLTNKLSRCGASSLKTGHKALDGAEIIYTQTLKLDDWTKDNGIENVDLIWIDVQGSEREVLDGARNLLKKTRYVWTEYGEIEYSGGMSWGQTKSKLKDNFKLINYESFIYASGDMFFKNKSIGE